MISKILEVKNKTGLHARPISQIIKVISKYKSKTIFKVGDNKVENKSVLGFLKLGAKYGTKVEIEIDGEDENEVLKELEELFYSNFGELYEKNSCSMWIRSSNITNSCFKN